MHDIYKLDLLEELVLNNRMKDDESRLSVRRVPGGWVFTTYELSEEECSNNFQHRLSSVFVPFSDEFKPKAEFRGSEPSIIG